MNIPIIIVCYNNYKYVKNTLLQISKINKEYYKNIQILNNQSTCLDTINFLNNVDVKVIHNNSNSGPWIAPDKNRHIYDILPDKYILTDPDLKFNENIPSNFIEILVKLSDKYKTGRIGFALDISEPDNFYKLIYRNNQDIYNWEKRFWINKINDCDYELYYAAVDTTFCLMNKNYFNSAHIRIAGNFTAKHLPWYIENEIYNVYEKYLACINTTSISSNSKIILKYIEETYLKINKNKETYFIKNDTTDPNIFFWKNIYSNWENCRFEVFDKYLSHDKIFIDIGAWIGTTSMYGSRKSKHVYSIEADNKSFDDMNKNLKTNCANNYTLINKAIFNIDNIKIKFGKNLFLKDSKINDSNSQIYNDDLISDEFNLVETITIKNIIENYNINPSEIALIKVDIEGGEENILNDLFDIHTTYNIPLYISFHYTWWNDKNLDRFEFLTSTIKDKILAEPFTSIVF
jgi:FkbM family methyltransferase